MEPIEHAQQMEEICQNVRDLAVLAPDYVYAKGPSDTCTYRADERNPLGCLIGAAARLANINLDGFDEDCDAASAIGMALGTPLTNDRIMKYVYRMEHWCNKVQEAQDIGRTWNNAVAHADLAMIDH